MDIYYFYNGIQNIINVALRNDAYLLNYEKIIQDPLIFLDFDKSNTCIKGGSVPPDAAPAGTNKKSDKKNNGNGNGNGKDNNEIDDKIAELKQAMKQKNDECKAIYDVNNKTNTNTNKKSLKIGSIDLPLTELSNALSIFKSDNSVSKYRLKMDCDKEILVMNEKIEELETQKKAAGAEEEEEEEEEEESEIEDSDDDDSGAQVMESIKMIIKFIVFISLLTIIPLAPFIAISYYSFKKLKLYYDERMLTL